MTHDRSILEAALVGYQERMKEIEQKIEELRRQLGRRDTTTRAGKSERGISEEGRARIAEAQRKRWAKIKQGRGRKN